MSYFLNALSAALSLLLQFNADLYLIVWTSLKIALTATFMSAVVTVPVAMFVAVNDFKGKVFLLQCLNTLMAIPTVMIGLIFYGLLSRRGVFGEYGLLYSDTAIILGEMCLITPIIMNMVVGAVHAADVRLVTTLQSLGATQIQLLIPLFKEQKWLIFAAVVTAFGRAIGEVGAAMMLGGNIQGSTRTITTAIALETSKGEFELGLALGLVLLLIAFVVNVVLQQLTAMST